MECPKEKRAVRRALFLPFGKRTDGLQGADSAEAQHLPARRASLLFDAEEAREASEDEQANNVSNEALYVIGSHGSGDRISRYFQDWEERIGHAVPRIIRSGKETWLVWFLSEPVG